jgi:hypothetical protein
MNLGLDQRGQLRRNDKRDRLNPHLVEGVVMLLYILL